MNNLVIYNFRKRPMLDDLSGYKMSGKLRELYFIRFRVTDGRSHKCDFFENEREEEESKKRR